MARVVVDLVHPVGYSSDSQGRACWCACTPWPRPGRISKPPPSPPSPRAISRLSCRWFRGASGVVVEAGSRLAADSAVTAGAETTILRLARGGEVRVCPRTTLSVTPSENGRDLMLGMSTGALEAHYTLERLRRFRGHARLPHAALGSGRSSLCDQRQCSRRYLRPRLAGKYGFGDRFRTDRQWHLPGEIQRAGFLSFGTARPDGDYGARRLRLSAAANPGDARGADRRPRFPRRICRRRCTWRSPEKKPSRCRLPSQAATMPAQDASSVTGDGDHRSS